jgi:hypothetical protein
MRLQGEPGKAVTPKADATAQTPKKEATMKAEQSELSKAKTSDAADVAASESEKVNGLT